MSAILPGLGANHPAIGSVSQTQPSLQTNRPTKMTETTKYRPVGAPVDIVGQRTPWLDNVDSGDRVKTV